MYNFKNPACDSDVQVRLGTMEVGIEKRVMFVAGEL